MRISDWSSDVCSSDLQPNVAVHTLGEVATAEPQTPTCLALIRPQPHQGHLRMPAMHRFVEVYLAHELVEHRRDAWGSPHLGKTAALDDDPNLALQTLDRLVWTGAQGLEVGKRGPALWGVGHP